MHTKKEIEKTQIHNLAGSLGSSKGNPIIKGMESLLAVIQKELEIVISSSICQAPNNKHYTATLYEHLEGGYHGTIKNDRHMLEKLGKK